MDAKWSRGRFEDAGAAVTEMMIVALVREKVGMGRRNACFGIREIQMTISEKYSLQQQMTIVSPRLGESGDD